MQTIKTAFVSLQLDAPQMQVAVRDYIVSWEIALVHLNALKSRQHQQIVLRRIIMDAQRIQTVAILQQNVVANILKFAL